MLRFLFIITSLLPFISSAQLKLDNSITIQVSCGFAAQTSKEVLQMRSLLKSQQYDQIHSKQQQGTSLDQLVSTIALLELEKEGKLEISVEERKTIDLYTRSTMRYALCFTCTVHLEGTIKILFEAKDKDGAYEIIRYGLFQKEKNK